mmetsp:Transcript_38326/g.108356  ORF Transcript_38326/g.108356 Transcript_38326/m.108356 type:complete len:407 (-) Transcript_38326:404-1624(-)|eukprot:CAMPEP_0117660128 /NCGR_PEP_ID=MMETSP0804-20121206/6800_1 /TAXON_ID=1074897 /ORGANISM="Tetraselmis astigmatica, Strain CCMP880" /LENGTH=406 /DNA_ID=CAMNT_0005466831 /DNA_START=353 /DNA_END=1573 /DNA_ORIENTATION=-
MVCMRAVIAILFVGHAWQLTALPEAVSRPAGEHCQLLGSVGSGWQQSNHTNNWAVLVCTSRFWFNYRHMANVLSVYHTVKHLGIPDSNIILMLSDDMACNPRNPKPSAVFNNRAQALNLYGTHVEVDYRGYEVTVESFLRVLTGRHEDAVPQSKRLMSDSNSNVLVMLTGHGGDEFMKFQDDEELMAQDLADAIAQMHEQRRYNELLMLVETCEAATMWKRVYSPGVMGMASSILGEKSYSHHSSSELGLSVIDRFTYYMLQFFEEKKDMGGRSTMQELFDYVKDKPLDSTAAFFTKLFQRDPSEVLVTDFFGAVTEASPVTQFYDFQGQTTAPAKGDSSWPISHIPAEAAWAEDCAKCSENPRAPAGAWAVQGLSVDLLAVAMLLLVAILAVALQPKLDRLPIAR